MNVQRFRGRLVFEDHRHLHHSTLGLRIIKKEKKVSTRVVTYEYSSERKSVLDHARFIEIPKTVSWNR